jgi:hypothetical protein
VKIIYLFPLILISFYVFAETSEPSREIDNYSKDLCLGSIHPVCYRFKSGFSRVSFINRGALTDEQSVSITDIVKLNSRIEEIEQSSDTFNDLGQCPYPFTIEELKEERVETFRRFCLESQQFDLLADLLKRFVDI